MSMKKEAYWERKEIEVIGNAVVMVANQKGMPPMAVLHSVMEWIDERERDEDE